LLIVHYNRYVKNIRVRQKALNNYYNDYLYSKDYYDAYILEILKQEEILKKENHFEAKKTENKITFYLEIDDFDLHASEYKQALYPTAIQTNNLIYINGVLWKPTITDFINKDYKNLKLLTDMNLTVGNASNFGAEETPAEIIAPTEEIY
jgi:hypothetical protein